MVRSNAFAWTQDEYKRFEVAIPAHWPVAPIGAAQEHPCARPRLFNLPLGTQFHRVDCMNRVCEDVVWTKTANHYPCPTEQENLWLLEYTAMMERDRIYLASKREG